MEAEGLQQGILSGLATSFHFKVSDLPKVWNRVPDSVICFFFVCECGDLFILFFVLILHYFLAWEDLEMVRGWIPIHLDQVSAQTDHSGSIWDPFLIVDFFRNPQNS